MTGRGHALGPPRLQHGQDARATEGPAQHAQILTTRRAAWPKSQAALSHALEPLEPRRHLSASASLSPDGTLLVRGTDGPDALRVVATTAGLQVSSGAAVLGTFPNATSLSIDALGGDDHIVVSPGVAVPTTVAGGDGSDTLVVSSPNATLMGGSGTDALWAGKRTRLATPDLDPLERRRGVNRLPDVFSSVNVSPGRPSSGRAVGSLLDQAKDALSDAGDTLSDLAGDVANSARKLLSADVRATLREPGLTSVAAGRADFSYLPLFGPGGPLASDVAQGALNSCYLLASLSSLAGTDTSLLRQVITDLSDGTFAVRFFSRGAARYYRVDADLPLKAGTTDRVVYANPQGASESASLWVPLIEKAFALDRGGSYARLDKGGWMADVYRALGVTARTVAAAPSLGLGLLTRTAFDLAQGRAATLGTRTRLSTNSPLIANHAYAIESITFDSQGRPESITLRNPQRWDGPQANGVVTFAAKVVLAALSAVVIGG